MSSPNPERSSRVGLLATAGIAAALQLIVVNHWPGFPSPNERARAYQAIAVASRGALDIDVEVARFGAMEDTAAAGGHLYPNKAPGLLPLLVPAALIARLLAPAGGDAELALTAVLGRILAASLPLFIGVLLLAAYLDRDAPRGGPLATAAWALASPALAASLLLFSHALTATLLLAAFVTLHSRQRPDPWRAAVAGLALGWAVTCEYTTVVPAAVLAALAIARVRLAGSLALAAGAAVPALALAAYNQACFGSPFSLSTSHETYAGFATLVQQGVFGISRPTLSGVAGLLLSPERGILVWAPFLLLALAGLRHPGAGERGDRAVLALAPLALLVVMSGYPNWHGGWFPGPRYLLPAVPFAVILAGRGAERLLARSGGRVLTAAALLWSVAVTWLSLAAFPFPPEDYPLPAVTFSLPLLSAGVLIPSWLPRALAVVAIALLAAAAAALLLRLAIPRIARREAAVAVLAAAGALAVAFVAVPRPASWQARIEWAVVHDVYASAPAPGALEALLPECETRAQRDQVERWIAERERLRGAPAAAATP